MPALASALLLPALPKTTLAQTSVTADFPTLHTLGLDELQKFGLSDDEPTRLRAELVRIRRIAGRSPDDAAETLEQLNDTLLFEMTPSEWYYQQALRIEILCRTGKLEQAEQILTEIRPLAGEVRDPSARAAVLLAEALYLARTGQQNEAISTYRRARYIAEAAGDVVLALYARQNEGAAQMQLGMTHLALEQMTAVRENIDMFPPDDMNLSVIQFNLAYLQSLSGEYESALAGFLKNRPVWVELGFEHRAFIVTTQIARALNMLGRHEEAIAELTNWLDNHHVDHGPDLMADALLILGEATLQTGDYARTEQAIVDARRLIDESGGSARLTEFLILEASLLSARGQLERARQTIATAIASFEPDAKSRNAVDALLVQADILSRLHEHAAALESQREAMRMQRELRSAEFDRQLSAAVATNEQERAARELEMLRAREGLAEARQDRDRAYQLALLGIGALLALIAYLVFSQLSRERRARGRLEEEMAERTEQVREEMEKRLEAERAQQGLEDRLIEDEKYRAVAKLTGGLAHDFNNLMTVVSCSAELVKLRATDPDIGELADDVLDAADAGTRVTRSLIAYARQQALHPEVIRLDEFLTSNESLFRNTLGEHIELVIDVEPATVEIDRASLTTALLNVLFNAREAMPTHGRVSIRLRADDAAQTTPRYRLSIEDTGRGMDDETKQRALEPFFSTKKSGKTSGMGLGLSTVYGFMRQSNGNVEIESTPNQGTVVHLLFPAATDAKVADDPGELRPPTRFTLRAPSVLLVEDQDRIRRLTRQALEASDYIVEDCGNGAEAIELLNGRTRFDIVISDVVMPGPFNGLDVARVARKVDANTRILLTSGHTEVVPRDFEFLAKPYSVAMLLQRLEDLSGSMDDAGGGQA